MTPYILALAALALLLLRQKFNAETDTLGFSCATQPKKNNNRKKEDEQ